MLSSFSNKIYPTTNRTDFVCLQTDNIFRRVIQYAISLGGDTDTIASMAGALAGAHLGADSINANILKHCEGVDMAVSLADELLDAVNSPPPSSWLYLESDNF